MKQILTLFILIISIKGLSQDSTARPLSKYEQFVGRSGIMFKMEELSLGKGRMVEVVYHKATNLQDGNYSESVALGGYGTSYWSSSNVLRIDMDELPDVIKAIEYYTSLIKKPRSAYKEWYSFITKNRVSVQCSFQPAGIWKGWYITFAQLYQYLSSPIAGSIVSLKEKDINEVLSLLKQASNTKIQ